MEDVPAVYQRPYDPRRPAVRLGEKSEDRHTTPRGGLPAKPRAGAEPDRPARRDYEYGRSGTANLFLWVEPLAGRLDSAHQLKALTDEHHAEAEVVVLVTDNW